MLFAKVFNKEFLNTTSIMLMILLYVSDDTLLFGTNENSTFIFAKYVIVALCGVFMLLKSKHICQNDLVLLSSLLVLFIITAALNVFRYGFLYNLLLLFVSLLFARLCKFEDFKRYFCSFIYILAIISIVVYFSYLLYPSFFDRFPVYRIEGADEYICLYVADIYKPISFRNFGIFREPGVYMIYLNLALFMEWFSDSPSNKKIFVYLLCLMTTISTAGILIGLMIIGMGIVSREKSKILLAVIPIALLGWWFINNSELPIDVLLFSKFEEGNSNAIVRWASLTVPFKIFLENPLGVGPEGYNELCPVFSNQMYHFALDPRETTNTFFKILAVYGIIIFIIYLRGIWGFIKSCVQRNYHRLVLVLILILAFSNEDMRTSILFSLMIAYGYTTSYREVNKKKEVKVIN